MQDEEYNYHNDAQDDGSQRHKYRFIFDRFLQFQLISPFEAYASCMSRDLYFLLVKIESGRFFLALLLFLGTDCEPELIGSHKGRAKAEKKARKINPQSEPDSCDQKIAATQTHKERHQQGEP